MPVTPINADYSNINSFVDSLFSSDVRTIGPINQAIQNNQYIAPFSNQNAQIIPVLLAAWQASQGDSYSSTDYNHCPDLDKPIVAFIANYIKTNSLEISIPQLSLVSSSSSGPTYCLDSYQTQAFIDENGNWNYTVVNDFLNLLLNGAHFVSIQSNFSLPNGPDVQDLWTEFQENSSINGNERTDTSSAIGISAIGNSHYASVTNLNGYYYPSVTEDTAPNPCSFLLSLLVCTTIANHVSNSSSYETFFQLEGWQLPPNALKIKNSRHDADYNLYKECYWNISTYGACAYSEKRGTAIFLAPSSWVPAPTSGTFMPPYAGAETPQKWLQTNLITL